MIDKNERLRRGDILRNDWCDDSNPTHYGMYIGRGKVGHTDCFMLIGYDGKKRGYAVDNNRLVNVGHLDEYDSFVASLKALDHSVGGDES